MASGTQLRAQRPRTALLLVDDEALASAISELLTEQGWETDEVESFRDAKDAVDRIHPGVFIVDPGLHVDLLERFVGRLALEERAPGVVVLSDLLSAASIANHHNVTFMHEPFDLDDLSRAVEAARQGEGPVRHRLAK